MANNAPSLNGFVGHGRHSPQSRIDTYSVMGFPGTGKGTLVEFMLQACTATSREAFHLEAGNIVRTHIKANTPFGQLAKDFSSRGLLVPDEYIVPQLAGAIRALPTEQDWLLDGFPRKGKQIEPYEALMEELGRNDRILHLSLSDDPKVAREIAEERMRKRGELAIATGHTPRKDDIDPDSRRKRLDEAQELEPVIAHFAARNRVLKIDATQTIQGVRDQVHGLVFPHNQYPYGIMKEAQR